MVCTCCCVVWPCEFKIQKKDVLLLPLLLLLLTKYVKKKLKIHYLLVIIIIIISIILKTVSYRRVCTEYPYYILKSSEKIQY